jgi:Na+/glutamate symporter
VKTGPNLAKSSKEGYGSKRAVLPLMMMMILLCITIEKYLKEVINITGHQLEVPFMLSVFIPCINGMFMNKRSEIETIMDRTDQH